MKRQMLEDLGIHFISLPLSPLVSLGGNGVGLHWPKLRKCGIGSSNSNGLVMRRDPDLN